MIKEIIEWHEVKKRKPIGDMPENGEEILIATPYGVSTDTCGLDYDYGYYLEETGDWDDVIAWAYFPKGPKKGKK